MKPYTHYTPTENGFAISASNDFFNRTLYGSHKNDYKPERFFTFAGDVPKFMGAITDWTKDTFSTYEKCGILVSGLAVTPGQRTAFYYSEDIDQTSRWFHDSEDVCAEFKNGWMEYRLTQISSWAPDVRVNIEAYPLLPDDGYLIHYRISTDQRIFFTAGFGGITDTCEARFEYRGEPKRNFSAKDTVGNTITIGKNRAHVKHTDGKAMFVATSFDADFAIGSANAMSAPYPSTFLGNEPENENDCVVKISAPIEPGEVLDGYIIAIYNSDEGTLDKWLSIKEPVSHIKQQIYAKYACIDVSTPQKTLDLTIAPTVIALDSSWHKDSFHHGSFAYHAPFLGWRNWYAPTALGWGDRVETTMAMWLSYISRGSVEDEHVWYDYSVIPDGEDKFDRRFHMLENPVGRLPSDFSAVDTPTYGPYNMQECALDMMLYYIEWSGNLKIAEKYYDDLCSMVEWERRMFDPDDDGLYQNLLNTWISDGHNYNGAGCAQSTAYNYRANLVLSRIAEKIGRDGKVFAQRAEKIKRALNEKLWVNQDGVIAEYLDTVGNCLIHPAIELPSVYHVIDSDMVDFFKAYRMLRYTENRLKNIVTPGTDGRLCYSSDWLPKQYSNHGIFPAENAHLALMYFKLGLKNEGKKILDGISDCYFTGKNPGMAPHVQSALCTSDLGDLDFSDVSSTYLRLVIEGLFGIRINNLEGYVYIQPGFPDEWDNASLTLKDIALHYTRKGNAEILNIYCDKNEKKLIRIPMRSGSIESVMLDGVPVSYKTVAHPNNSFIVVEIDKIGRFQLRVMHGCAPVPTVTYPENVLAQNRMVFEVKDAVITDIFDVSETLHDIKIVCNKVYATAKDTFGKHTLFLRTASGEYDAWLAADYTIEQEKNEEVPLESKPFDPVDISNFFNCNMTEVHEQAYIRPRPEGYSMGLFQNGRYSHNWNQMGRHVVYVDDTMFRTSGGIIHSPSGIPFITPENGKNLACVTMFDTFPTQVTVPLGGKGQEIAVMFIASTNCMLSHVENARITVTYTDGTSQHVKLVYPFNIDDWLTSALTTEAEIFYFSNVNHATVQRIRINPEKELADIKIEAVANDVILGVAGISISRI
ncbi:MAG: hypothetical protein E7588_08960 [Ruminococcaceae bacterium]|nr:hypothetical protein [Oscillospiraceae bacterium]